MTPKEEETVRTSIILPRTLHDRLGHAAVETRVSATQIVRDALTAYLDAHDRKRRGRKGGTR